ncbi:hypothetical protein, partial [Ornithobacterium rhinotracheale]
WERGAMAKILLIFRLWHVLSWLRFCNDLFVVLNIIYKFVAMINTNNKFWWWCSSDPSVL